jgi:hypothetical protein
MLIDYYVAISYSVLFSHLVTANLYYFHVGDVVDIIGTLTSLKRLSLQANRFQGTSFFPPASFVRTFATPSYQSEFNTLRCATTKNCIGEAFELSCKYLGNFP